MKKLFCLIVMMTMCLSVSYAQKSLDSGQLSLRNNIMSFLKEEGYVPTIDEDGDIQFKREGDVYFISVSESDSAPYYVELMKLYGYGETYTKAKVTSLIPEINKYKMIKLMIGDSSWWFESEMFVANSNAFTSVFNRILKAMDAAEEEVFE
ncbi:MAG: hypothetical protein J5637_00305 [Prevotella sp.]|nr:hypothetical protein [Prevotella sp.]